MEGQILRIPTTLQHQTMGLRLTPGQLRRDGNYRRGLAGTHSRQGREEPREAAQEVRWLSATRDKTEDTLLITWARNPRLQPVVQRGGRKLPALTVGKLIALLEQLPPDLPVQAEGCDRVNGMQGVGVYRLAPDDEHGPQCIPVAQNDYYCVRGSALKERVAAARRVQEQASGRSRSEATLA